LAAVVWILFSVPFAQLAAHSGLFCCRGIPLAMAFSGQIQLNAHSMDELLCAASQYNIPVSRGGAVGLHKDWAFEAGLKNPNACNGLPDSEMRATQWFAGNCGGFPALGGWRRATEPQRIWYAGKRSAGPDDGSGGNMERT